MVGYPKKKNLCEVNEIGKVKEAVQNNETLQINLPQPWAHECIYIGVSLKVRRGILWWMTQMGKLLQIIIYSGQRQWMLYKIVQCS